MRFLALLWLVPFIASGYSYEAPLPNAAQEATAQKMFRELKCAVCEGQTLESSNALLAADMRKLIRDKTEAGETEAQIKNYLADRYGEVILLEPREQKERLGLWLFPGLILLIAIFMILSCYKRHF